MKIITTIKDFLHPLSYIKSFVLGAGFMILFVAFVYGIGAIALSLAPLLTPGCILELVVLSFFLAYVYLIYRVLFD